MRRNNGLIRDILLDLEAYPLSVARREVFIDGFSSAAIKDHLLLLHQHRLIECLLIWGAKGELTDVFVKQITAEGHSFLRGAKDALVWEKTLALAKSFEFPLFISSLQAFVEELLEEVIVPPSPKPYRF